MKVVLEEIDPSNLAPTRVRQSSPIHEKLAMVKNDSKYHGRLLSVAVYDLPDEEGKAHTAKQLMQSTYGGNATVLGFTFSVARSADGSEEYLVAKFTPDDIVAGNYGMFQKAKAVKAQQASDRRDIIAEVAAGELLMEDGEVQWQAAGGLPGKLSDRVAAALK
jgi:hypothetical protein